MHILTWEYAQKKAPFFTFSLDCELTYPFLLMRMPLLLLTIFKAAYWRVWIR